jgi:hypothetical protein
MNPVSFGVVQIQKVPMSSEFTNHCITLQPGIHIGNQSDKGIMDKIQFDILIDQFLEGENSKKSKLTDLFDGWEREINSLNDRVFKKIGVDVMTLGSKRTVKEHKCRFCGKIFSKAQALGGHISKMHSEVGRIRINSKDNSENKKKRISKPRAKK